MKTAIVLTLALLGGCGQEGEEDVRIAAHSCSVAEIPEGAHITCTDGTEHVVRHGENGLDGEDGLAGETGATGETGARGARGKTGADGKSFANELVYVGAYCGRTVIKHGAQHYVIHSNLVPLTDVWYKVSNSCEVRIVEGKVVTQ